MPSGLAASGAAARQAPDAPVGQPVLPCQQKTWIEIVLLGGGGDPIAGERYKVVDATGKSHGGALDAAGFARIEPVAGGECLVSFPGIVPGEGAPATEAGPAVGANAYEYHLGQPARGCAAGARHTFHVEDWALVELGDVPDDDAPPPDEETSHEEWDLATLEEVPDDEG